MGSITANVLGGIGNTPLVQLRNVVPRGSGRVLAKLEWANPTGSMKDRMADAAVTHAEADGRLGPGGTVVEYTSGTTGISLALVCAAKGYGLEIVFSDAFSEEKRRTMQAFGARVTDVRSVNKQITEASLSNLQNPRSSRASRRARTRSKGSASDLSRRCGSRNSSTRSIRSRRRRRRKWPDGWRERKESLRACHRARTSSQPSGLHAASAQAPRLPRSSSTPD